MLPLHLLFFVLAPFLNLVLGRLTATGDPLSTLNGGHRDYDLTEEEVDDPLVINGRCVRLNSCEMRRAYNLYKNLHTGEYYRTDRVLRRRCSPSVFGFNNYCRAIGDHCFGVLNRGYTKHRYEYGASMYDVACYENIRLDEHGNVLNPVPIPTDFPFPDDFDFGVDFTQPPPQRRSCRRGERCDEMKRGKGGAEMKEIGV
ncbi:hypothetical protein E4U55_007275 [Claviceps digitariae]|nr:hypothetical protein E4U55_007275 [Claviceps digitariae]